MSQSWVRALSAHKRRYRCNFDLLGGTAANLHNPRFFSTVRVASLRSISCSCGAKSTTGWLCGVRNIVAVEIAPLKHQKLSNGFPFRVQGTSQFCTSVRIIEQEILSDPPLCENGNVDLDSACVELPEICAADGTKAARAAAKPVDFLKVDISLLPNVLLVGRPNVGKSALFNRLIRRREALVYNTPEDHVTRDIREGIAKLGDLRFKVLDSAGLEMAASSGSILGRTAGMTAHVLAKCHVALFLIDVREGLHPVDLDVGKWLRKYAPGINIIVAMNKCESLDNSVGSLAAAAGEVYDLGFGDPIAISAETGLGMTDLYDTLRPFLEDYMLHINNGEASENKLHAEGEEPMLPLQLAIVGRPNVGKSTLLNALLQEDRVIVGPEAGLTRDSVRVHFQFQGRTVYLVDTAGWLQRTKHEKGPASLSVMQSRKNLLRAHIVALVLDAEEIAKESRSMKHAEVVIARQAVEEGRGLVVIVNKMDLLSGKKNSKLYEKVINAVPEEIQTVIPQVTGIPVVFISAMEGRGRTAVMRQVVQTYEKWCLRLSTARLNRWLRKVMSRHSWKDGQSKIKFFTQVKARPPTFVAFTSGKAKLSDSELRFLSKSLKEDFDIGGIPIRIMQRSTPKSAKGDSSSSKSRSTPKMVVRTLSEKRSMSV